jgi:choline-sulfatase
MPRILFLLLCITNLAQAAKPNVLFIFADDQCYQTIAAHGHPVIETPNLDRLSRRGVSFTHAYNMGSWSPAVCLASRAMMITGRSLWDAQQIQDQLEPQRQAGSFWPQLMADAGYQTYCSGKWHIKMDANKIFHHTTHIRGGMPKDTAEGYNRPLSNQPDPWSPSDPQFGGFWEGGTHWSEVLGDDATDFLHQAKARPEQPFFMYIAFNAPHDPRQSPAEFVDKYPLDKIQLPPNFLPEYPHKDLIGCPPSLRDEKLAPFPRTEHAIKVHLQEYYAIITHMDHQIGRILDTLEANGQADNTYILFTADHGLAVGQHGLVGKQNMYDHSLRVPFIIAGPNIPAHQTNSAPIYLQDAMATALEIAQAAKPEHIAFQSLLPHINKPDSSPKREVIYGAYLHLQRAIIHQDWKLIVYPEAKVTRLYHLSTDPHEMQDLAPHPEHQARAKSLFQILLAEQKNLQDPLDLTPLFRELHPQE